MKFKAFKIGLVASITSLIMCGAVSADVATYSTTVEDVTATLTTEKTDYEFGEEINYTLTIENNRNGYNADANVMKYTNNGLKQLNDDSMPANLPIIRCGESYTVTGTLVGKDVAEGESRPAVVEDDGNSSADTDSSSGDKAVKNNTTRWLIPVIVVACCLVCVACIVFVVLKKRKSTGIKMLVGALITASMMGSLLSIDASAATAYEKVSLRPYLKLTYGGEAVTVRVVIDLPMVQPIVKVPTENRDQAQTICCHDPSIFVDSDNKYYVVGSFLAGGTSEDLHNWKSLDSEIQGKFTDEVKEQIRAWNKDENASNWNSYLWAPDIIYNPIMEKYCMYLSANGDDWKSNIVLLTADKVTGPYDYAGSIVYGGFSDEDFGETDAPFVLGEDTIPDRYVKNGVKNKKWGDMYPNCIDPCVFYDKDGKLWMSYGSWSGGIFMLELDENTGLRDYDVKYETNIHSDAYFGTKVAGGAYVSGEASYIQQIGDYYFLFISYGGLEAKSGYNVRIFRSDRPDGDYVDIMGNTPYYDKYEFNFNQSIGVRLFGAYKWRTMTQGQVAQGHNSAFVDNDGRAYIVFHTRTTDGSEGHFVKVHQLFLNEDNWLVAAPYHANGESISNTISAEDIAGNYDFITHRLDIDYANLDTAKPDAIALNSDGTITKNGETVGEFSLNNEYITLTIDGQEYKGVALWMNVENSNLSVPTFTAVGTNNQITVWGSRQFE